jgi:histone arginine demethylase JMJD6
MGHKRWVLIEPGSRITKRLVRGRSLVKSNEDDEAIHYFDFILPRIKEKEGHRLNMIEGI